MRFCLGDIEFQSKAAAREAVREILNRYNFKESVSLGDARLLLSVLEMHGNAEQKIGSGVRSFEVEPDEFGHRCFWLTRVDGTRTYFSYLWCFKKSPSEVQRARFAFRSEVQDQILSFKTQSFSGHELVQCSLTGDLVAWREAHVDHTPSFVLLRDNFLRARKLELSDVVVQQWREGEHRYLFADRALACEWSDFHRQNARLQIVSAQANLEKG